LQQVAELVQVSPGLLQPSAQAVAWAPQPALALRQLLHAVLGAWPAQ
jgi:hypothetical protein